MRHKAHVVTAELVARPLVSCLTEVEDALVHPHVLEGQTAFLCCSSDAGSLAQVQPEGLQSGLPAHDSRAARAAWTALRMGSQTKRRQADAVEVLKG